jgi:hypothetical protein
MINEYCHVNLIGLRWDEGVLIGATMFNGSEQCYILHFILHPFY